MSFDKGKVLAGALFMWVLVFMPGIPLLLGEYGFKSQILARVLVGLGGFLAASLLWQGLHGPEQEAVAKRPMYVGLRPAFLVAGILLFYLAWVSNFPQYIAGQGSVKVVVRGPQGTLEMGGVMARVVTSALTMVGALALKAGCKSPVPPEVRKDRRVAKKAARRARADQYLVEEESTA